MPYILIIFLFFLTKNMPRGFASGTSKYERLVFGDLTKIHNHAIATGDHVVVVSRNGRGHYTSIKDGLRSHPMQRSGRVVVYVKAGVYEEYISIYRENVTFLGDGIGKTIVRSSRSEATNHDILTSGALNVWGTGFVAIGISFENVADVKDGRAVALHSAGDRSAFYRCSFTGFQDTLFVDEGKQFFRECLVEGTIDFIFGDAAVVFQNCIIRVRKPEDGQHNVITAQGRRVSRRKTGIVIQHCKLKRAANFAAKSYLGRPWKKFSRTIIMQSFIGDLIDPLGWAEMASNPRVDKLVYREFSNRGPGAATGRRVRWPGYRVMDLHEARRYSVARFIQGLRWLPATGIPFTPWVVRRR